MVFGKNGWNPRQWASKGKETFSILEKLLLNRCFIFSNEVTLAMTDVYFSVATLFLFLLSGFRKEWGRLGSPPLPPWSPGEPSGQLELFVPSQNSDTFSFLKLSLPLCDSPTIERGDLPTVRP